MSNKKEYKHYLIENQDVNNFIFAHFLTENRSLLIISRLATFELQMSNNFQKV